MKDAANIWTQTEGHALYKCPACRSTKRYEIIAKYEHKTVPAGYSLNGTFHQERVIDAPRGRYVQGAPADCDMPVLPCPDCGRKIRGQKVRGVNTGKVKQCNAKCMGATGPACDCPCEGENHGSGHAA